MVTDAEMKVSIYNLTSIQFFFNSQFVRSLGKQSLVSLEQ